MAASPIVSPIRHDPAVTPVQYAAPRFSHNYTYNDTVYPVAFQAIDGNQFRFPLEGIDRTEAEPLPLPAVNGAAPGGGAPQVRLPIGDAPPGNQIDISSRNGLISLVARDAPLSTVLGLIAQQHGLNVVTSADVNASVSVTLNNVRLEDALEAILSVHGYTWSRQNHIISISSLANTNRNSMLHGKQVRVFNLNFIAALDADRVVKGLLSPAGQSFITETAINDKRRTRERLIVEDLPIYLARIEAYIAQADQAPRQVQVQAHVLAVQLTDENRHGINWDSILRVGNAKLSFKSQGFANPASSPGFLFGIDSTDMKAVLEALTTTTRAKTLAAPKLLVLNGQEARIQIGEQLGYLVTTTTETSTLQNVNFLDLGVVLRVKPLISDDNQILMSVKPEVSSGRINPANNLPEEETTEVETSVVVGNGQGMIIGGLIKEQDVENVSKIPFLGDLYLFGRLFQRRSTLRERIEIIVVLMPQIAPPASECLPPEVDYLRATTPLLNECLEPNRDGLSVRVDAGAQAMPMVAAMPSAPQAAATVKNKSK